MCDSQLWCRKMMQIKLRKTTLYDFAFIKRVGIDEG